MADLSLCLCLAGTKCDRKSKKDQEKCKEFRDGAIKWFCGVKPAIR